MRRLALGLALLLVAACGGDAEPAADRRNLPTIRLDVPMTVVGELEIAVEEGPVGTDDLSEVNFGSVTTDDGVVLIEVWADVVRESGVTRDELVAGGRYRVEVVAFGQYATPELPSHRVGSLEPAG